jgi:hypothetical protein
MSIESRIRHLEARTDQQTNEHVQIIIYRSGERPGPDPDCRVAIYIPDNGRGPIEPDDTQAMAIPTFA